MKVLSAKSAIALAICLGCVPRPARSIPVHAETGISICRSNTTSLAGCFSPKNAEIVVTSDEDFAELELRAVPFRAPDEIPPVSGQPHEPITAPEPRPVAPAPDSPVPPAPNRPAPPAPRRKGKGPANQQPPQPNRPPPPPPRRHGKPQPAPKEPPSSPPNRPPPPDPPSRDPDPKFDGKPETENPGVGTGLGGPAKGMNEYQVLGNQQIAAYGAVLKSDKPDTSILKTKEEVDQHPLKTAFLDYRENKGYKTKQKTDVNTAGLKPVWNFKESDIGFNIRDTDKVTQITVSREGNTEGEVITEGAFDPNGKFMVYSNTFKVENDLVPDHVPLNEIAMQNFINVAGANTKNLQAAFITNVKNKGFYDITKRNYFDAKQTFQRVVSFPRGTLEFSRIIGSDNVFSKMFSYMNHHNALGDKEIKKIVIMPRQSPGSDSELSIAIVFAKKD